MFPTPFFECRKAFTVALWSAFERTVATKELVIRIPGHTTLPTSLHLRATMDLCEQFNMRTGVCAVPHRPMSWCYMSIHNRCDGIVVKLDEVLRALRLDAATVLAAHLTFRKIGPITRQPIAWDPRTRVMMHRAKDVLGYEVEFPIELLDAPFYVSGESDDDGTTIAVFESKQVTYSTLCPILEEPVLKTADSVSKSWSDVLGFPVRIRGHVGQLLRHCLEMATQEVLGSQPWPFVKPLGPGLYHGVAATYVRVRSRQGQKPALTFERP